MGLFFFQGMNEIIGPLYYVFSSDPNTEWQGLLIILNYYNLCQAPYHTGPGCSKDDPGFA